MSKDLTSTWLASVQCSSDLPNDWFEADLPFEDPTDKSRKELVSVSVEPSDSTGCSTSSGPSSGSVDPDADYSGADFFPTRDIGTSIDVSGCSGDVSLRIDDSFATGTSNWTGYPASPINSFGHPGCSSQFDHPYASATGGSVVAPFGSSGSTAFSHTIEPGSITNRQKPYVIPLRMNHVAPKKIEMSSREPSRVWKKRITVEGVDVLTLPLMDGTVIHTRNFSLRLLYELPKRKITQTEFARGVLGMTQSYLSRLFASKDPWEELLEKWKESWLKIKKWFEMSTKDQEDVLWGGKKLIL